VTTATAVYWDPYDPAFAADPYPIYRRLREEAPLYYNERYDFYAVTRFADCERGLPDWRTFSSAKGGILELIKSGIDIPPGTLIFEDPPAHDIHRRLLARMFTPRRIAALEPLVRDYCVKALDPLVGADRFDIMETLGLELPMKVIGWLLGIPEEDQRTVRETQGNLRTADGKPVDFQGGATLTNEVFAAYIDWRRDHPSDDLMTELLNAEFEDENGVEQVGHEVVRRMIATPVDVVGEHLVGEVRPLLEVHLPAGLGAQVGVGRIPDERLVGLGDAEQHADHPHRHLGADLGDEVEAVGADERVEGALAEPADLRFQGRDPARGEDAGQQLAVDVVDRGVLEDEGARRDLDTRLDQLKDSAAG
jgi:hypothetical protein